MKELNFENLDILEVDEKTIRIIVEFEESKEVKIFDLSINEFKLLVIKNDMKKKISIDTKMEISHA